MVKKQDSLGLNLSCVTYLVAQTVKNLPAVWEIQVQPLGQEDPEEKGMATHSGIVCEISWREEPGGLLSMGLQRARRDRPTNTSLSDTYWLGD